MIAPLLIQLILFVIAAFFAALAAANNPGRPNWIALAVLFFIFAMMVPPINGLVIAP